MIYEAALDLSDLFNVSLQGDDIQDFDTRWDQALLSASEASEENAQLQTVFAMYDQEIDRYRAVPSYQRLQTMVRRHTEQDSQLQSLE